VKFAHAVAAACAENFHQIRSRIFSEGRQLKAESAYQFIAVIDRLGGDGCNGMTSC
jgi:hypothetical protein